MAVIRRLFLALALLTFSPMAAAAQSLPAVTAADRVLGRADAPVTVVEYASFICPHCADWHLNVLPAFKARFIDTGQVRLVYRDLPTDPVQLSATAAALGRCAAPGRFFEVAEVLMRGQAAVRAGGDMAAWYGPAIQASGRTRPEIEACIARPDTLTDMQAEMQGGTAAGVTGTPTFFVNGRKVDDSSLDGLSAAITPLLPAG
jgi:protein-disulfide isomerase